MKRIFNFFFEEKKTDAPLVGMIFLFLSQMWLLILLPYLSPTASEDHILGFFGYYLADVLIRTLFGLSAFLLPLSFLWIGMHGVLKKENLSHTIQQIICFSVFFFALNILLLSSPLIHTSWAGLFPLFFYSLLAHFFPIEDSLSFQMNWQGVLLVTFVAIAALLLFVVSLRFRVGSFKKAFSKGLKIFSDCKNYTVLESKNIWIFVKGACSKLQHTSFYKFFRRFFLGGISAERTFNPVKSYGFYFKGSEAGKLGNRSVSKNGEEVEHSRKQSNFFQKIDGALLQDELGTIAEDAVRVLTENEVERLQNRLFSEEKALPKTKKNTVIDDVGSSKQTLPFVKSDMQYDKSERNESLNWKAIVGENNVENVIDLSSTNLFAKGTPFTTTASEVSIENFFNAAVPTVEETIDTGRDDSLKESNSVQKSLETSGNDAISGVLLGGPAALNRNLQLVERRQVCTASVNCLCPSTGVGNNIWNGEKSAKSEDITNETVVMGDKLVETFQEFGIAIKVERVVSGPVLRQYQISLEPGVRIQRVVALADNLALALAAPSLRIVAPIPGKSLIGIEVPKKNRQTVLLSAMINKDAISKRDFREKFFKSLSSLDKKQQHKNLFPSQLPIAFGVSILGEMQTSDLAKTPHLLIAGATGSGKSVCVNAIITSLLLVFSPNELRLLMIDPKMVELNVYNGIPHLLHPVISQAKDASKALEWVIREMENRYKLLERCGVRNIVSYNEMLSRVNDEDPRKNSMPYIVVVIDELADLMMTARREVEDSLCRLAAMSRAVGIHLILATQRPSVDVITGLIKSNFPSRIAFQVSSKIDSRTIIDGSGAEKLLGKGDMLMQSTEYSLQRLQGAFLSEEEVKGVVANLVNKADGEQELMEGILGEDENSAEVVGSEDEMFSKGLEIVVSEQKASASYLQRRLKIGYNRAARLIEEMEKHGYVGPADGAKPREVFISSL